MKTHHVGKLLNNFDIGTQILFEYEWEKWQNSTNITVSAEKVTYSNPVEPIKPVEPVEPQTLSENDEQHVTLSNILSKSKKGIGLLKTYADNNYFSDAQRKVLIEVIVGYYHENNLTMTLKKSTSLEEDIINRFPTEKLVNLTLKCSVILFDFKPVF